MSHAAHSRDMEHLTTLDAGFLEAEDSDRHVSLAIGALSVIAGPMPDFDSLVTGLAERILSVPRFRQVLRTSRSTRQRSDQSDHGAVLEERQLPGAEVVEKRPERFGPLRTLRVQPRQPASRSNGGVADTVSTPAHAVDRHLFPQGLFDEFCGGRIGFDIR